MPDTTVDTQTTEQLTKTIDKMLDSIKAKMQATPPAACKVTPVVKNVVDIEQGGAYLNIDTEGDVFIETPGDTMMVMGKDEVADFTAVVRGYIAYIDDAHEEAKPDPTTTPTPQVGDWVMVLKDGADNSGIMAGVHEVLGDAITPGSVEVYEEAANA